ncbi:MAG TPA: ATP synthase F1 subunit gamma [Bacteroidia bacterium]|nr:ATP synthase F1 subunit gamma [Bacteroidia bacterium]HNT79654.1 ATP synthase F1 subunit gamma [Bacteroidia bacterium]
MPSLKEVRVRISSVNSTQQITKAMKMVSAAKLRRATDAILQLRPYAEKLREVLENLSSSIEDSSVGVFTKERTVKNILIVAINSNKGLCGAFNTNIVRGINRMLREEYASVAQKGQVKVLCIGRKASDIFSKNKELYVGNRNEIYTNLNFNEAEKIAEEIMQQFAEGSYDKVLLVYNQFKNAAVQYVTTEQLLPVVPPTGPESKTQNDYIFEPTQEEIVLDLIPTSVKTQLYKAILDSHASEHGARMTAMSKATDNAGELLRDLRLSYNKARQAAITKEILEIVGGAEALKSA